jgi:hypothetical protein
VRRGEVARRIFASMVCPAIEQVGNCEDVRRHKCNLVLFRQAMPQNEIDGLIALLDRYLYPYLSAVCARIPASAITDMRRNYEEQLPKIMRLKTAYLDRTKGRARRAADSLGITELLNSEALRSLAERTTEKRLLPRPNCQAICYDAGDFAGPHNDHHPEQTALRNGYVDVHVMLGKSTVESQVLVYEKHDGLLNAVEEVGRGAAIAVYQLPFWHYTTPLTARNGAQGARRWLLMASYTPDRRNMRPGSTRGLRS